jgi:Gas vesicle synthesis protein GvpO
MADERVEHAAPRRKKPRRDRATDDAPARTDGRAISGRELAAGARRQLSEITGMEVGAVTALQRGDDDGWKVRVELVELSRIPRVADVMGIYEVTLDAKGALTEYRRLRRYSRGETGGADG